MGTVAVLINHVCRETAPRRGGLKGERKADASIWGEEASSRR